MASFISCQSCGKEYPLSWTWYICDKCGYRICPNCLGHHSGKYSSGGYKCSQCAFGKIKRK